MCGLYGWWEWQVGLFGDGQCRRGRLVTTALEVETDVIGLGVAIGIGALAEGVANDGVSFF